MKQKKAKKGVVMVAERSLKGSFYKLHEHWMWLSSDSWHRRGFPKLNPGDSCKVRVTIERVK